MTENMKKLLELASSNEELRTRLNSAFKEELIALAKEQGITLTKADFEAPAGEINDDELEAVAGGKKCYCLAGGGGTGEEKNKTEFCACILSGVGFMEDGQYRCGCNVAGHGINRPHLYG